MVSRRKILSRSRDDLNLEHQYQQQQEEEEDVWYQKDKLYKVSVTFMLTEKNTYTIFIQWWWFTKHTYTNTLTIVMNSNARCDIAYMRQVNSWKKRKKKLACALVIHVNRLKMCHSWSNSVENTHNCSAKLNNEFETTFYVRFPAIRCTIYSYP